VPVPRLTSCIRVSIPRRFPPVSCQWLAAQSDDSGRPPRQETRATARVRVKTAGW